ncbi:bis(5'-nucleosyl)-tetraphosphatase (symmetrical) YqeK [uncultured Megasphaera sp.]|uniref:bis(5'-nucleosyl)-tetraphosphatase (symmetrical) YqeK n=1 Tax=uncultured Megasphaera sp. TaxID=165188 RepID=UPI0025FE84E9|nr:bis(5'-nucleosyl)-tetraphosphatase (symmetrical) YqeK [uncultured Megasphaera sp.]
MYNEEFKDTIKRDLKETLSSHRYTHVLGVAAAARELAERYGCDADTAEVAGLLHDAAKQLPLEEMRELAEKSFPHLAAPILANGGLLHGYAAVTIAKERYQISDTDLLAAVAHHTTGAEQMSTLEKVIFLADYIEVNRDFDGVEDLRKAAKKNLDEAVLLGYDSTIRHLLDQGKPIFVGTVVNRNAQIDVLCAADRKA